MRLRDLVIGNVYRDGILDLDGMEACPRPWFINLGGSHKLPGGGGFSDDSAIIDDRTYEPAHPGMKGLLSEDPAVPFHDFGDGNGLVPAGRHPNGGGWVADSATVAKTAFVGPTGKVYGEARVLDKARVYGQARIYGEARVLDKARVYGEARVLDKAQVCGEARIYDEARVLDKAQVCGEARVLDGARISGEALVHDNAQAFHSAKVYGHAIVRGHARVYSSARIFGNALISRHAEIFGESKVHGDAVVGDHSIVEGMELSGSVASPVKALVNPGQSNRRDSPGNATSYTATANYAAYATYYAVNAAINAYGTTKKEDTMSNESYPEPAASATLQSMTRSGAVGLKMVGASECSDAVKTASRAAAIKLIPPEHIALLDTPIGQALVDLLVPLAVRYAADNGLFHKASPQVGAVMELAFQAHVFKHGKVLTRAAKTVMSEMAGNIGDIVSLGKSIMDPEEGGLLGMFADLDTVDETIKTAEVVTK